MRINLYSVYSSIRDQLALSPLIARFVGGNCEGHRVLAFEPTLQSPRPGTWAPLQSEPGHVDPGRGGRRGWRRGWRSG